MGCWFDRYEKIFGRDWRIFLFAKRYRYIFLKFAWALPIKKKDGATVSKAFGKITKTAESQKHKSPNLRHTDKGLNLRINILKNLLNNFNIKMYRTLNEEKSTIIERFNRTINSKTRIQFEPRSNKKWVDVLQDFLDEYQL